MTTEASQKVCFETEPSLIESLTKRERQVLMLIADGYTTAIIAKTLHVSKHTVNIHRQSIRDKTSIRNISDAVNLSIKSGLIPVP